MVFIQIIWTQEQVAGVSVSISGTTDALLKDYLCETSAWCHEKYITCRVRSPWLVSNPVFYWYSYLWQVSNLL